MSRGSVTISVNLSDGKTTEITNGREVGNAMDCLDEAKDIMRDFADYGTDADKWTSFTVIVTRGQLPTERSIS